MTTCGSDFSEYYAIETKGISKHFGAVRAVDELSISIPRFGITSIVGPNGSGKSTLINLLSGVLPLDGGIVVIDGVGLRGRQSSRYAGTRDYAELPGGAAVRPDFGVGQYNGGAYGTEAISFDGGAVKVGAQGEDGGDS